MAFTRTQDQNWLDYQDPEQQDQPFNAPVYGDGSAVSDPQQPRGDLQSTSQASTAPTGNAPDTSTSASTGLWAPKPGVIVDTNTGQTMPIPGGPDPDAPGGAYPRTGTPPPPPGGGGGGGSYPTTAPAGFDQAKWSDPTHTSAKYVVGRIIASGGSIQDAAAAVGGTVVGRDKIQMPNGEIYDAIFDEEGAHLPMWEFAGGGSSGGGGQPPAGGAGTGGSDPLSQLRSMMGQGTGAGYTFGQTPFGNLFGDTSGYQGNVGQDDFSKLLTGKLSELISNNGYLGPDTEALHLENVRQAADRARKAEMAGARDSLAARGLLSNDPGTGLEADALARIERNDIAPLFSNAIRDYQLAQAENAQGNLRYALSEGTNRQNVLSQIALQNLSQNIAFNEFLATFGLDRDRTLYELASGQNENVLQLLLLFLNAVKTGNAGYV